MKKLIKAILLVAAVAIFKPASAQTTDTTAFTGAKATLSHYNALYIINTADEHKIKGTLRNLANALDDPRLKGKLTVELIAFGDGVAVYQKSGPFEQVLTALKAKGVILAQCANTVRERHIDKNTLFPFIAYVPSGNGEIILRQYEGWATVHP